MNFLIEIIVYLIVYGLILYLAYRLYMKYNKIIGLHLEEVVNEWPDIPVWLNWILGIFLFLICISAQVTMFVESIIIWLVLLIVVPFFYLHIMNSRIYNFLSVSTFFLTTFFSITLFFSVNNSRDIIGKSLISNYEVHYTREYHEYEDREILVAHISTENKTLDFVLESIFPLVYSIFIVFVVIFSLLLNISLREKNKIIKRGIR